ncbi:MOSC domain-containing protein [Cellulomonas timonensis]|uniref:MOSC domain-containing protein n=1 Tax=Cellulomonas timonensis TaxID=1689271 RepID=UPI00083315A7|nr:MOSC N-terminal beta barrel domain-containing protein [Cellulomonas timonensis]
MHVGELNLFPVKSLRGVSVESADVERLGLAGDRRWMVVDERGETLTARKLPAMLAITVTLAPRGIVLHTAGRAPLSVPEPAGRADTAVTLSRLEVATAADARAHAWLSEVLGRPVRLVWLDDPSRRPMSQAHGGGPGDPLSLADAGPLLLTTASSLRQLDAWAVEEAHARGEAPAPIVMERFRPNLVVAGDDVEPFAEDAWGRLRIGDVEYRFAEHCDRCVLTTVDPHTRLRGKEPLRSLALHRRWDGKVWFGIRVVPVGAGRVAVGDEVVVTG